jgi:hypothetical protein
MFSQFFYDSSITHFPINVRQIIKSYNYFPVLSSHTSKEITTFFDELVQQFGLPYFASMQRIRYSCCYQSTRVSTNCVENQCSSLFVLSMTQIQNYIQTFMYSRFNLDKVCFDTLAITFLNKLPMPYWFNQMVIGSMQCYAIFNAMINIGFSRNTMRQACKLIITSNRLGNIHPYIYTLFDCSSQEKYIKVY